MCYCALQYFEASSSANRGCGYAVRPVFPFQNAMLVLPGMGLIAMLAKLYFAMTVAS